MLTSLDGYGVRSGRDTGVEWNRCLGTLQLYNPARYLQEHNKAPPGNRSMQVPALFRAVGTARVGGALYVACTRSLRSPPGLREYMYCAASAGSESSRGVGFSFAPGGPEIGSRLPDRGVLT